jgi:phospholipid/cholesterol/gamma-HCH transport system substrate-binding protein
VPEYVSRWRRGPDRRAIIRFSGFALLTLALTVYMAVRIIGTGFGDSYTLVARFDNVAGLKKGDLVKTAGVPIGRVSGVKVVQGKAQVRLTVQKRIRMPDDSAASIRWRDLLGTREVYLAAGRSHSLLGDGGEIPRTESSVDLGAVINNLGPLTGSLDPQQLNQVLQAFATALEGNEGNVNQITSNLSLLLTTFADRTATIGQMTHDYKVVTDAIGQRDMEIGQTVQNLHALTKAFNSNQSTLTSALTQLRSFSGNLNAVTNDKTRQISQIVTSTQLLLGTAHKHSKVLSGIVQGLPSALQALMTTQSGGHFARASLVCINLTFTPKCPFPEVLPPPAAQTGNLSRMSAKERTTFGGLVSLLLLSSVTGGR